MELKSNLTVGLFECQIVVCKTVRARSKVLPVKTEGLLGVYQVYY